MDATRKSVNLLNAFSQEDVKKQQETVALIANLEKSLLAAKANLKVVNQQVKAKSLKIVQSQREIVKLNANKDRFGKICQQVGVMTSGNEYR